MGRKQPGEQYVKQVLATNVDIAFLVQSLDHDFSPERIQRYLFQLGNEGVKPVIVLHKADKETDIQK
ncbi:GTPase RsgA [Candidatus Saccharibacteria bacterium]|nr:MAG: GTPase RsgA [Candidatus Saccharibacteria bacterium]